AAEALGAQIARQGWRLAMYSPGTRFIEGDVLRGYLNGAPLKPRSVVVYYPTGWAGFPEFPEFREQPDVFDLRQDSSKNWEISYYRSISQVDGMFLVGGGQATLIAGTIAIAFGIPLVALPGYGGKALEVWQSLKAETDLTEDQVNSMARKFSDQSLKLWLGCLQTQIRARNQTKKINKALFPPLLTLALLVGWILILAVGIYNEPSQSQSGSRDGYTESGQRPMPEVSLTANVPPAASPSTSPVTTVKPNTVQQHNTPLVFLCLLFLGPVVAGASGASIRVIGLKPQDAIVADCIVGAAAGGICALLYVVAQLATNTHPYNTIVLTFTIAIGFVAGLTSRRIFRQLEGVQILRTGALESKFKTTEPPD
ncbi:MAG: hypothetical protein JO331_02660, partial [Verrucomicrobia bacterium]|nr:hypothetical protein [Verrucomicrobiota bacterium]